MLGLVLAAIVIGTAEAFVGPSSAALLSLRARLPAGLSSLRINSCVHAVHSHAHIYIRIVVHSCFCLSLRAVTHLLPTLRRTEIRGAHAHTLQM
jgi:hypothetical protein